MRRFILALTLFLAIVFARPAAAAPTYTKLTDFGGVNGSSPSYGNLIADTAGNLYGMTALGGTYGKGQIFKIKPDGTYYDLHDFTGGYDGANPNGSLTLSLMRKPSMVWPKKAARMVSARSS